MLIPSPWIEQTHAFSQAICLSNDRSYILYDTRASVYESINCFNSALRDAKKTIEIAPSKWHSYFCSARLLASFRQSEAALGMCSNALLRLSDGPEDQSRRLELTELRHHLEAPRPKCHVSSVPVELLLKFFKLSNNPDIISHVCHRWRDVTHSQPALWRNLVLTAPPESALRKINKWRKQSSGWIAELSIRKSLGATLFPSGVGSLYGTQHETSEMYTDIVAALRQLDLTKLKECHMQDVATGQFLPALDGGMGFVNNLATLSSRCECHLYEASQFECDTLSWQSLRTLSLVSVRCNWVELSISMHHLTSFEYKIHIGVIDFSRFHEFLRANISLEKLVIEIITEPTVPFNETNILYFPDTPLEPLTLSHLHHLELKGIVPFHIKHGNFSLPSLRILRIPSLKDAVSELSSLIEDEGTSFAELVEFTTRGRLIGRQNLSSILLRAPKLEILRCTDIDSVVAESLSKLCVALLQDPASTEDPGKLVPVQLPVLCPALRVLDFSWSLQLKTDPVVQIIKERTALAASQGGTYQLPGLDGKQKVSRIQMLKVDGCRHIEQDKLPWLQENVSEFSCRYHSKWKS